MVQLRQGQDHIQQNPHPGVLRTRHRVLINGDVFLLGAVIDRSYYGDSRTHPRPSGCKIMEEEKSVLPGTSQGVGALETEYLKSRCPRHQPASMLSSRLQAPPSAEMISWTDKDRDGNLQKQDEEKACMCLWPISIAA
ncbi:hypothetical protein M406DRAFT_325730 [Cryphonectria parasitica EP155]|uniref:Uncharacterized protein n=1 Tax=Cryphonectria parasitica (strain ATCC 38755 / EP155) TaxID=660469 RepID=A0A9P4YCS9_CRYP1|nr:uncharacterized protein M406DRAFT_325730 [Cryphonectria parasitica EP155]KAF3770280.1 hypothetical protein M406DRAFT_325730 [Cryphonectria parasitica EP155]